MIFSPEQLNFLKFSSVVFDEFPVTLRSAFAFMWDNFVATTSGIPKWDDSITVHNLFQTKEGDPRKTRTPNKSYIEWSCTELFHATLFSQTFAMPDGTGRVSTLHSLYARPHGLSAGTFHSSVRSATGNPAETYALALDQLRLLRNTLCHQYRGEIDKATFAHYLSLAKDAFTALGQNTSRMDEIGKLAEDEFPTTRRRKQLEEDLNGEKDAAITLKEIDDHLIKIESKVEGVVSDVKDISTGVTDVKAQVEDVGSDVKDVETKVEYVGSDVKGVKTGVTDVKKQVENAGLDVRDIKTGVTEVKTQVKDVGLDVKDIKTGVTDVKTQVEDVGSNVRDVKTGVTEVKTQVKDLGSDVKDVKPGVTEVNPQVKDVGSDVKDVKTGVTEVKTQVKDVGSDVKDIKTRVTEVKTQVKDVGSDVKDIRTRVTDVKTQVEDIRSDVKELKADFAHKQRAMQWEGSKGLFGLYAVWRFENRYETAGKEAKKRQNMAAKRKSPDTEETRAQVKKFRHSWSIPRNKKQITNESKGRRRRPLPIVKDARLSKWCDAEEIVNRLQEELQKEQSSLEHPDPEAKKMIRCLARKAKCSRRLDVVKRLREVTPAGTTGPMLPEDLDVEVIPFEQGRKLSVNLCGGDEWMMVAERLGLTPAEIRFLDKRCRNPFEEALIHSRNQRYWNVGQLYDVLVDCGFQSFADFL